MKSRINFLTPFISHGIVLDFSLMNRILDIRLEDFQADVEPGLVYFESRENIPVMGGWDRLDG